MEKKTKMMKKIIDKTETTKDGIETVRCGDTLQMLGKSFIQDGVRYFVPMCPHPKEYETITVRGRFCSLCETKKTPDKWVVVKIDNNTDIPF